jgi:hypothetical protein
MIIARRRLSWLLVPSMFVAWLIGIGYGGYRIWQYATTPGSQGVHPARWPRASQLRRSGLRDTLLIFVHPGCPCSRASLAELTRFRSITGDSVEIFIVFLLPDLTTAEWERTDTWTAATRVPHAELLTDTMGTEAARFGAETSGQVLLYNAEGDLTFAGGITGSRGHEGDNPALREVLALVDSHPPRLRQSSVYGCPLSDGAF